MNTKQLNKILKPYWGPRWDGYVRIEDGWCELIHNLHKQISEIVPTYTLCQIKQKFGGLRYYYDLPIGTDETVADHIEELVDLAELLAKNTCELCGSSDSVDTVSVKRWLQTLCVNCKPETSSEDQARYARWMS